MNKLTIIVTYYNAEEYITGCLESIKQQRTQDFNLIIVNDGSTDQSKKLMDEAIKDADIVVTATGNKDIVTADHMRDMKDRAILCNIGHFDNEIQVEALKNYKWDEIKPQVHEIELPSKKRIIL